MIMGVKTLGAARCASLLSRRNLPLEGFLNDIPTS